ncbi:chromate efflux transporter [Ancylobacter pratisalsi]|uniref:Chromate efflux transporter n=1 Tax=Ancylobacter pratisalsi TaxID=1745854 RepID=A0A6P1YJ14_9HYPH|nr:chromate efflux transporter [Ancylobacter pratisalsi]QIB33000.1 chromate efflux transporter [Ancylobacter pratisalsi]
MSDTHSKASGRHSRIADAGEVFVAFLKLGLTSFGGPVAHLGYFREELVRRRSWLGEEAYANIVALCQFLPGPASSQVGMAIGLMRAGPAGMAAAWLGFTLPSALAMIAFAYGVAGANAAGDGAAGWLGGLKVAAVAIVADAVLGMARNLCPDRERRTIALVAAAGAALAPGAAGQIGVILAGALVGLAWLRPATGEAEPMSGHLPDRVRALAAFAFFALLLVLLPLAARVSGDAGLALADTLYRAGALVFGGGHVVLPLIESELVHPGGLTREAFLAGYGAVQAVPGPLFSFAAYVGAMMPVPPNGALGGIIGLVAIFLPSALLVYAALPFWTRLAGQPRIRSAMAGINAAVVGLLGAAFWDPVVTSGITSGRAFALALIAYLALALWRVPAWAIVIGAALGGAALL